MSAQQSGEKTEKATPRKRKQARENAQLLKSTELIGALTMLVLFAILSLFGDRMVSGLEALMTDYLGMGTNLPGTITQDYLQQTTVDIVKRLLTILLPVLAGTVACAVIFNYMQIGFFFSTKPLMPRLDRLNPLAGLGRMFSRQALAQLLKSLLKLTVLGLVAYNTYKSHMHEFANTMELSVEDGVIYLSKLLFSMARSMTLVLAVLGPVDYFYEWFKREKELMMTKQELKDEYKITEGNPQIKNQIRRRQRQISGQRMMQAVSTADVVVTNPTHFAVALAYDESQNRAPVVVAKGKDHLARKIKEKARQEKIAIMENKTLARALYADCDIGDEVPEQLYQAVAEILAYVYKLKNNLGRVMK